MPKHKEIRLKPSLEKAIRQGINRVFDDSKRLRYIVENRLKVCEYRVFRPEGSVDVFFVIDEYDNTIAEGSTYQQAIDKAMKKHEQN